jgi:hypothetical protein
MSAPENLRERLVGGGGMLNNIAEFADLDQTIESIVEMNSRD